MKVRFIIAAAIIATFAISAIAQSTEGQSIVIYALGASIDGTVGIGPIEADVDVSASDIFDNLEMGGMAVYRNDMGRWSWGAEGIFMGLGNHGGFADIDVDELMVAATAGYDVNDRFELLGGLRYMDIEAEVLVLGPLGGGGYAKTGESWIDPFVGVRVVIPAGKRSSVVLQGSVGGFGVGSDFALDAAGVFEFGISARTSAIFGYRLLAVDYEDGSGTDYFKYDTTTQGPAAGVRIRF